MMLLVHKIESVPSLSRHRQIQAMKTKLFNFHSRSLVPPSKWSRPVLVALAISATALIIGGCKDSNDSDDHRNHPNQNHPMHGNQ